MILVDLKDKAKIEDFDDVIILVNMDHARWFDNFNHQIIPLTEFKSFEKMQPGEKLYLAGHGGAGVLIDSAMPSLSKGAKFDLSKSDDTLLGVSHFIRLAIDDAKTQKIAVPKEFIVQSCHGASHLFKMGDSLDDFNKMTTKNFRNDFNRGPSIVRALSILFAKYNLTNQRATGFNGPAVSAYVIGKETIVLSDNPSNYDSIKQKHNYANMKQRAESEKNMDKKIAQAVKDSVLFFRDFMEAAVKEGKIVHNAKITETFEDGKRHLRDSKPVGYKNTSGFNW